MYEVINHLRLRDPVTDETLAAFREAADLVVSAGGDAAQVVKVDERHLVLLLMFASSEDAERVSKEVGGPWMREHIAPLLVSDTERHVGEVVVSTRRS